MKYVAGAGITNCDLLYSGIQHLPEEGTEVYSKAFEMQLGGGAPAVMVNLTRLGVPAALSTFLSNDFFSEYAKKEIERAGVPYQNLFAGDGMAVNVSSTMITPGERTFVSYRDSFAVTEEMKEKIFCQLVGADIVRMSPEMYDIYARLKAEKPEITLVMDTGWNEHMSLESYAKYLKLADYFTPNSKEAMKITGTASPQRAAEVLSDYFEKTIIKLGGEGCLLLENGRTEIIPPLVGIRAVDVTGAGDAFMAGFLYGLYYEYPIRECILFGNVMGGKCTEKLGCLTASLTEKQMLEYVSLLRAS
ncbi:MAG: carbohydrate kinase family protein [Marvinbryantia sp.]|uniref:carbohydrate kinase family protein n=1 Tax=Marvinbryantia sp. TaxID=2496532 RepID=UPI0025F9198A|nr:carbohydrate kinase family protein [uncultured Marvinbryantia sp.]